MKKIFKPVGYLILIPVVALIIANLWPDAELNPVATEWLSRDDYPSEEDNSFFDIVGFDAPKGEDPHKYGIDYYNALRAHFEKTGEWAIKELNPKNSLSSAEIVRDVNSSICQPDSETLCIRQYQEDPVATDNMQQNYGFLRTRYIELRNRPIFYDVTEPRSFDSPILFDLSLVVASHRLYIAKVYEQFAHELPHAGILELTTDIGYLRSVLASNNSLLAKLAYTDLLQRDLQLLAEIVGLRPNDLNLRRTVENLAELTQTELSFTEAFKAEFQYWEGTTVQSVTEGLEPGWFPLGIAKLICPTRINRTLNLIHPIYEWNATMSNFSATLLFDNFNSGVGKKFQISLSDYLLNPCVSVRLVDQDAGAVSLASYAIRTHGVNALMRLVKLKTAIIANDIQVGTIEAFLANVDGELKNPFTGEPMQYDSEAQKLFYPVAFKDAPDVDFREISFVFE